MAEAIRVGFIGAGFVNFGGAAGPWDHATRLEKMLDVQVAGICDPDQGRARQQLERRQRGARPEIYAKCQILGDWEQLLEETKPDAVIIGLPPGAHGTSTGKSAVEVGCAKRGIHMLIEKPLAVGNPDDVKQVAEILSSSKSRTGGPLVVSVGYMLRYNGVVDQLKAVLKTAAAEGRRPAVLTAMYASAYENILSPMFWDRRKSGGPIIEQATHFVDLSRYLLGEIDLSSISAKQIGPEADLGQLQAMPKSPSGSAVDAGLAMGDRIARATAAHWRFTSGAIGTLVHTLLLQGRSYDTQLEVVADGLRAELRDPYSDACQLIVRDRDFRTEHKPLSGHNDPYLDEMDAFINAIRYGRLELIRSPYSDAAKTFEVTCRITEAASRGA